MNAPGRLLLALGGRERLPLGAAALYYNYNYYNILYLITTIYYKYYTVLHILLYIILKYTVVYDIILQYSTS